MIQRPQRLFLLLGGVFITSAILAEFIGVKIFSLEKTMGLVPIAWQIGSFELSFEMTAGVLLWPVVFILTDIINEYFGSKGVRLITYMTVGLISYAFMMVFLSIRLTPAEWWLGVNEARGISNMQDAFSVVFSQGNWIIIASLIAFLVGQLVDVTIYHQIRKWSGEKWVGLRATGSTLVSQLLDSFVVLFIAFGIGAGWPISKVLAIGLINYIYKFCVAIILTPVLYWVHGLIDIYLGHEQAHKMKLKAAEN